MQAKKPAKDAPPISPPQRSGCPISFALEIFGDRWTLLVLRDLLLRSRTRFRELLASPEGIATNVLADRLKQLERRGLIRKERDPDDARQFIYRPTPLAVTTVPMLLEMAAWGHRTNTQVRTKPGLLRRFETDRDKTIAQIQEQVRRLGGLK